MKYFSVLFLLLLFDFSVSAQGKVYGCRPASETDVPLGGNVTITQTAGKVKRIKGVTTFPGGGKYFEDVVVEVFEVTDIEKQEIEDNAWKIPDNKTRIIACITGKNGKFGFKNLPEGMYVLRVGTRTREVEYFNYVFVIVEIDPKNGINKNIEVALEVAT